MDELDKKLLSDDKKDQMIKIVHNTIQNVKNIDTDLLEWGNSVLAAAESKNIPIEKQDLTMDANAPLDELLAHRRSIRSFKSDPLPEQFLNDIITSALWAPVGCDRQNICFLPVTKKEDIIYCQKCAGEPGKFAKKVPLGIVVSGNWPLCVARISGENIKLNQPFVSPKGEQAWISKNDSTFWVYPNWIIDLDKKKNILKSAGYSLFITIKEPIPREITIKKRQGTWNWELGLR